MNRYIRQSPRYVHQRNEHAYEYVSIILPIVDKFKPLETGVQG